MTPGMGKPVLISMRDLSLRGGATEMGEVDGSGSLFDSTFAQVCLGNAVVLRRPGVGLRRGSGRRLEWMSIGARLLPW